MKVSQALPIIQSLVSDPRGQFCTLEYTLPLLQAGLNLLSQEVLTNPNLDQLCAIVVLPNVPVQTTNFSAYFGPGQPLELLTNIISMKERQAGGSRGEQDWILMDEALDPPTIGVSAFSRFYTFTGATILSPGADQALDFRIFGKFASVPLVNGDSPLPPGISPIPEFRTAALIATARQNPNLKRDYDAYADRAQSAYVANIIMELQKTKTRQQPFSGRSWRPR